LSSTHKNLSDIGLDQLPDASSMRFGIVVSEWNGPVTDALYIAAAKTLMDSKAKAENIVRIDVPGSFELPLGAQALYLSQKPDAIICIGCVIQGETRHFDFICNSVSQGLVDLSIKHNAPFIFGVLTTNTIEQALERAGGKHGNKGVEAAVTALKMVELQKTLSK
jgi:6,7-dimethyl-8-ribityllumazine synthase